MRKWILSCVVFMGVVASLSGTTPEWTFNMESVPIVCSNLSTNFAGLNNTPLQVLDNGECYMFFCVSDTINTTRTQHLVHLDSNGNLISMEAILPAEIGHYDGSICIDPDTQDPFYVWEDAQDNWGLVNIQLGIAAYHQGESEENLLTPITVFDNANPENLPFEPLVEDEIYMNPNIFISKAPSYESDGKRRLYITTCSVLNGGSGSYLEPRIAFCDFSTTDIEDGFESVEWQYVSIPQLDEIVLDSDQNLGNFTYLFDCNWDGVFSVFGRIYTYQRAVNYFAMTNTNYGEGEWTFSTNPISFTVDVSQNQDGSNWPTGAIEGHFSGGFIGFPNLLRDSQGRLHLPIHLTFSWTTEDGFDSSPYYSQLRDVVFDPQSEEFTTSDMYPQSLTVDDGLPVLPWDIDEDGEVDRFDEETGQVEPQMALLYYAMHSERYSISANNRSCNNEELGWMASIWSEGLYAHLCSNYGGSQWPGWSGHPEIMISISNDHGDTWSPPIVMNANPQDSNYVAQLDGQIPSHAYLGNKIEDMGNGHGKLHILYRDENVYPGSLTLGGTVCYMALDIDFVSYNKTDVIPEPSEVSMLFPNVPNPFNPSTTISFSIPKDDKVVLKVYNIKGQLVKTLVNDHLEAGTHKAVWNGDNQSGKNVSSGIYLYRLESCGKSKAQKMLLLK